MEATQCFLVNSISIHKGIIAYFSPTPSSFHPQVQQNQETVNSELNRKKERRKSGEFLKYLQLSEFAKHRNKPEN